MVTLCFNSILKLFGMLAQIFCGNLTGQVSNYGLHVFFRCLSAVCCGQMYTAGQMICKLTFAFIYNPQSIYVRMRLTNPLLTNLTFESFVSSYRHNIWQTKNHNNLLFWAILVNWCHYFTGSCQFLHQLVAHLHGHIASNSFADIHSQVNIQITKHLRWVVKHSFSEP